MIENATMDAIRALQVEVSTLSKVVLQNRMALDLLTAKEGGVCMIINQSCCAYIGETQRTETDQILSCLTSRFYKHHQICPALWDQDSFPCLQFHLYSFSLTCCFIY